MANFLEDGSIKAENKLSSRQLFNDAPWTQLKLDVHHLDSFTSLLQSEIGY
jgi:hypothetical protein